MAAAYFATPHEAEAAFYDALERSDLDAMMAVWSEEEEVFCVHPSGQRLVGLAAVREVWRQMFLSTDKLVVRRSQPLMIAGLLLTVHHLVEHITLVSPTEGTQTLPPLLATNIFHRGAAGWRLVGHHVSASPGLSDQPHEPPAILH